MRDNGSYGGIEAMPQLDVVIVILAVLVGWIVLQRWILPLFGVKT